LIEKLELLFDLNRPSIDISKINNTEDFYTFETIEDIPSRYLFTFEEGNFTYGFDIRSFKKLIENTNINPYTRNKIPNDVILRFHSEYSNLKASNNIENHKEDVLTEEQMYNQRVLSIFQKMDALEVVASGTRTEWFTKLNFYQLKQLYKVLEDIWNYRTQMTLEQKCNIVPGNNIFKTNMYYVYTLKEHKEKYLKNLILTEIDKLVSSGITNEDKSTGCYYVLTAFTEISPQAAAELPWLVQ
jgi:hypothetical protein